MRTASRVALIPAILCLVAACTVAPPASPSPPDVTETASPAAPTPEATATPDATPRPSVARCAPPPDASPAAGPASSPPTAAETPLKSGPLEPGRYTTTRFEPRIALTLGAGWSALFDDDADEVALQRPARFLGLTRVTCVVDPMTRTATDVPDDLVAWLSEHDALTLEDAAEVTIGGLPGTMVEVTSTRTADLFHYPSGNFRAVADQRMRFYVLALDGPDLTITAAAPAAEGDAAFAEVEPVVDSLEVFP